jgi:hypothetical protein
MAAFDRLLHHALVLTALLCLPVGNALVTTLPAFPYFHPRWE